MTTHDNIKAKLKAFDAFAPVADALEAIPNLDVPGVARISAKRVTGLGEKFARTAATAVEKATATIENYSCVFDPGSSLAASVEPVQTALYQDVAVLFAGLRNLSAAATPTDALQIQSDYLRGRANAAAERQKVVEDYVGLAASKLEGPASWKAPSAGSEMAKPAGPGQRARILEGPASARLAWLMLKVSSICRRHGRPSQGAQTMNANPSPARRGGSERQPARRRPETGQVCRHGGPWRVSGPARHRALFERYFTPDFITSPPLRRLRSSEGWLTCSAVAVLFRHPLGAPYPTHRDYS